MTNPRLQQVYDGWNAASAWVAAHPKTAIVIALAVVGLIAILL